MEPGSSLPTLYVHTMRPEWGLAIMAAEDRTKRRFLFQDGQVRTFKRGFFHLIETADKPLDVAARVAHELSHKLDDGHPERNVVPARSEAGATFEDQVAIFGMLFEKGFEDPEWLDRVRGVGNGNRRKKHLEPAIADAQRLLAEDRLRGHLAAGEFEKVRADVLALLNATSLVNRKDREPLDELPPERLEDYAVAQVELLHGDGPLLDRFTRLMAALDTEDGPKVTWPLVTTPLALLHPTEHVAVKPAPFRRQAEWMAPTLVFAKKPNGTLYRRFLKMARAVKASLTKAGFAPRDLLDVHDFIVTTLRPKHLRMLEDADDTDAGRAAA